MLSSLLIIDVKKRLSASEVIKHAWFRRDPKLDDVEIDVDILDKLKNFDSESKLKKAAMNLLVKMLDESEVEYLK